MATTYFLTLTASDCTGGVDFTNTADETAPSANTLTYTVPNGNTQDDHGVTLVGNPSTEGGSGSRTYTAVVVIATGNADLQVSAAVRRINSSCTTQSTSSFATEEVAANGIHTFVLTSVDLGTFASGDRLILIVRMRDTSAHGNESITLTVSSIGTRVEAPWDLGAGALLYYGGGLATQRLNRGLGWVTGFMRFRKPLKEAFAYAAGFLFFALTLWAVLK